jgi:drug/metabolite transporter (DMT)-like permease
LVALAGVVLVATAQGTGNHSEPGATAMAAPLGMVLKAWNAGGLMIDNLVTGNEAEQSGMVLAGVALLMAIVRRSVRGNN